MKMCVDMRMSKRELVYCYYIESIVSISSAGA